MQNVICIVLLLGISFNNAFAKEPSKTNATQLQEYVPVVDGNVLEDQVWLAVPTVGTVLQKQPNYGLPVSEKTDFRIAYDETHRYVSAVCYDGDPDKIVVRDARRGT